MPQLIDISQGYSEENVNQAADVLLAGGVIIAPTDTLYGIISLADDPDAVERIYTMKKRDHHQALPLIACDLEQAERFAEFSENELTFVRHFWPGPLSIVVPLRNEFSKIKAADDGTVAIRVPAQKFCRDIAYACGALLTATSTNLTGAPSAKKIDEIDDEILAVTDLVFNSGLFENPPSTLIKLGEDAPAILREGAISKKEIVTYWKENL